MNLRTHERYILDSIERRSLAQSATDLRALFISDDTTKALDRLRKVGLVALRGENYVLTPAGTAAVRAQSPEAMAIAAEHNRRAAERRAGYQRAAKRKLNQRPA